jgi:hypothetical protein
MAFESHLATPAQTSHPAETGPQGRASARTGQYWFTKYTLAEALHVRAEEVQRWMDRGPLRKPNRRD